MSSVPSHYDEAASAIQRACSEGNVCLLVGAGISVENPANLPLANQFKRLAFRHLAMDNPDWWRSTKEMFYPYLDSDRLESMLQLVWEVVGPETLELNRSFQVWSA